MAGLLRRTEIYEESASLLCLPRRRLMNLMNACHMALVPLFCYESIAEGGVSFSKEDIGAFLKRALHLSTPAAAP